MKKEIIINATSSEIRVAITEDDRLAEIFLEVPDKERHVGSIYLGRVERVVQGMNAAFIDIGETQDAFLHFSDVGSALDEFKDLLDDKDDEEDDEENEKENAPNAEKKADGKERRNDRGRKEEKGKIDEQRPIEGRDVPEKQRDDRKRPDRNARPDNREGQRENRSEPREPRPDAREVKPEGRAEAAPEQRQTRQDGRQDRRDRDGKRDGRGEERTPTTNTTPREPEPRETTSRKDGRDRDDRRRNDRNQRPEETTGQERPDRHPSNAIRPENIEDEAATFEEMPEDIIEGNEAEESADQTNEGDDAGGRRRRRKRGRRGGRGRNRKRNEEGETAEEGQERPEMENETSEEPAGRTDGRNDRPRQEREERRPANQDRAERDRQNPPERSKRTSDDHRQDRAEPQQGSEPVKPSAPADQQATPRPETEDRRSRDHRGRDRRRSGRRDGDDRGPRAESPERTEGTREQRLPESKDRPEEHHEPKPEHRPGSRKERAPEDRSENRPERSSEEHHEGRTPAARPEPEPQSRESQAPAPAAPRANDRRREPRKDQRPPARAESAGDAPAPAVTPIEPAAPPADDATKATPAPRTRAPRRPARAKKKVEGTEEAPTSSPTADTPPVEKPVAATPAKKTKVPGEAPAKRPRAPRRSNRTRPGDDDASDAPVKGPTVDAKLPTFQTKRSGEVTIALEKGQDVIVQVTRESYASKGVRVTTKVSLPGRFLVLLPLDPAIGISRKVQNMKERRRLRRIAKSILPEGHGCIIRTVAQDKDEEVIKQDLMKLIENWREVEQKIKQREQPGLLYKDQSIANTVMRDLFTPDTNKVLIDNKALYKEIRDYVEWAAPGLVNKVELYTGTQPVFDQSGVEKEIQKISERKIYIPSGGYIILDQTEAMMVIDVNSGRYAGKKDQELNSLRTNLESAREIARQIRLRDIGGLIVVDFIDLYDEKNRKKVYDELKKEMKKDRAKSVVLPMTQFGLVQMTRQRIRQQVVQTISEPCPVCSGSGLVQSKSTVVRNIERWIQRFKESSREFHLTLTANPIITDYLTEGPMSRLTKMMLKYFVRVKIVPDESLPVDEFHFYSLRSQNDITDKFSDDSGNGARKRERERAEKERARKSEELAA